MKFSSRFAYQTKHGAPETILIWKDLDLDWASSLQNYEVQDLPGSF